MTVADNGKKVGLQID